VDFVSSSNEQFSFAFTYRYSILEGYLTLIPYQLYYEPAFPGIFQHKAIMAKSTFDVPINIKRIYCKDQRIQPKQVSSVIMPKNKSELALITFDPSKQNNQLNLVFQNPLISIQNLNS